MAELFKEIIPSIMQTKERVITRENEKDYVPWVVNYALGQYMDTVLQANEMNKYPDLPNFVQYEFLMATVRPMRRAYVPWPKKPKNDHILAFMHKFQVSRTKAEFDIRILTEEQREELYNSVKEMLEK